MTSTHFTTGTTITSEWLNDVNDAVYEGNITAEGVQYTPPFTGGVTETVEAKLAQTVSVKDFGAVGDGVTDDYDAWNNAVIYCAANGLQLYAPSTDAYYNIETNLEITCAFNAGLYRVFGGSGVVSFTSGKVGKIYPEWWGAYPYYNQVTDTGADSYDAFVSASACITESQISNQTNILPALCLTGTYKISDTVTFTDSVKIVGDTSAIWVSAPLVVYSGSDSINPSFHFTTAGYGGSVRVEGIGFVNRTSTNGAYALSFDANINSIYLNNNHMGGFYGNQLFAEFNGNDDIQILNNVFDVASVDKPVISCVAVSNCIISNNNFFDCKRMLAVTTKCVNTIFSNNVAYNIDHQNSNSFVLTPTDPFVSDISISNNRFKGINNGGEFIVIDNAKINIQLINNKIYSVSDVVYFLSSSPDTTITSSNNTTPSVGGVFYNSNSVDIEAKILHTDNDTDVVPLSNGLTFINEESFFDLGTAGNVPISSIPLNCIDIVKNQVSGTKSTSTASANVFQILNLVSNTSASGYLTVQVLLENVGVSLASGSATFFVYVDKSNSVRLANVSPIASAKDSNITALSAALTSSGSDELLSVNWTTTYSSYNYNIKATFSNSQSSGSDVVYIIEA